MSFHPLKLLSDEYYSAKGHESVLHTLRPSICDWTDYQVDRLAALLLSSLAEASLNAHPRYLMKLSAQNLEAVSLSLELKRAHNDILASNAITSQQEELSGRDEKSEKHGGDDDKKDN